MDTTTIERKPVIDKCIGCENIEGDKCRIWASPAGRWRLGICPSATHVKVTTKDVEQKVRVGQQKQRKSR